ADGAASVATGTGKLGGGSNGPFAVSLNAHLASERQLVLEWSFTAERDTAMTMCCIGIAPGQRFHGAGRGTVTDVAGSRSIDVPFGRTGVGSAVTALVMKDGS